VSITIVPVFQELFSDFNSTAAPEKGTVSTATSHWAAAETLSVPSICADPPIFSCNSFAVCAARVASREPITIRSPAFAQRYAKPVPSAPVPPIIAIVLAIRIAPFCYFLEP
jgi:hypothetical protein